MGNPLSEVVDGLVVAADFEVTAVDDLII